MKTLKSRPNRNLLRAKGQQTLNSLTNVSSNQPLELEIFDKAQTNQPISDVYARYNPQCFKVKGAAPHPTQLVESIAMGSVHPPIPNETNIVLPTRLVETGVLSNAQLETIIMAENSFSNDLPGHFYYDDNGQTMRDDNSKNSFKVRKGFFLGDGTGCGKGRQVAGIILNNWLKGHKRAIWVSKSSVLIEDAKRDWHDIGGASTDIYALSKWKPDDEISLQNGIIFVTYATLRSVSKSGKTRLEQLTNWLGHDFEGVVAFDEAHAMQNASGASSGRGVAKASQQGLAGLELQQKIPRARILYVSATGATTVNNLAYAIRLGLWGQGKEYAFSSREDFVTEMEAGGVAAMEVVARDLKALGLYSARALSFDGVEYDLLEHKLTNDQIQIYDTYASAFKIIHQNLQNALLATGVTSVDNKSEQGTSAVKSSLMSIFESTKQRFFNHLLQGLKAPTLISSIKADIEDGWSPVVQIVSTGEALLKRRLESLMPGDELTKGMFTPREYVLGYLHSAFPIYQHQLVEQEDGSVKAVQIRDANGQYIISREALALREEATQEIMAGAPIPSVLDQILWEFGEDAVSEVTGRSQRVVKTNDGRLKVQRRSASSNSVETKQFMDGQKSILIFSDAGGTGRSYQAGANVLNQKRRRHYLVEPGWRADNAIQGLGRTHRAAQVSAPFFRVCTTNVHGEKRFTSTIARRLDTLGALTKGQRETGTQGLFRDEDNLESPIARSSLRMFFYNMFDGTLNSTTLEEFTEWTALKLVGSDGLISDNLPPIQRFLNRVLALPIAMQNIIFAEFMEFISIATNKARQNGTLDIGLETLRGEKIRVKAPELLRTCKYSGSKTSLVPIEVDFKKTYLNAYEAVLKYSNLVPMFNTASENVALISSRPRQTFEDEMLIFERIICRPNGIEYILEDKFKTSNWIEYSQKKFIENWNKKVLTLPKIVTNKLFLVTGLILPVWNDIPSKEARIYRVPQKNGVALLGRALNETNANQLRSKFLKPCIETPKQILNAVLYAGARVNLNGGLEILSRQVAGQARLEICGADTPTRKWLVSIGCFTEIHQYQLRLFVPNTQCDLPIKILENILNTTGQSYAA